jgi:hypothetical protein
MRGERKKRSKRATSFVGYNRSKWLKMSLVGANELTTRRVKPHGQRQAESNNNGVSR